MGPGQVPPRSMCPLRPRLGTVPISCQVSIAHCIYLDRQLDVISVEVPAW